MLAPNIVIGKRFAHDGQRALTVIIFRLGYLNVKVIYQCQYLEQIRGLSSIVKTIHNRNTILLCKCRMM